MVVAKVGFITKGAVGSVYSYLVEDSVFNKLEHGQWVIIESERSKYGLGVFMGASEDQDQENKPFTWKKIIMGTDLPKEGV